jgi:hypothetical protein
MDLAYRLFDEARTVVQKVEHGERVGSGLNQQMRVACIDVREVLHHVEEALKKLVSTDNGITPETRVSQTETRTLEVSDVTR